MDDLSEIAALLRSIDGKLGQLLDPICRCGHRASEHSEGTLSGMNGCCVAHVGVPGGELTGGLVCDCDVFRRMVA